MHPELESEQAYVDHAYACLERMRRQMERAGEAGIGEVEALVLEAWAAKRLVTFEDAERGICFGRLDLDGAVRPLYVGRRWVHEEQTPIVVNWQAPASRPFYTATVAEPQGLTRRRRFRAQGRTLLDLYDEPLDGSAGDIVHGVADILLEELERSRDRHMRDIVATIQTDQYRLITREPEGALVIQGGPGTGKTAVGLHRASWLLYTYRRELERSGVLVVGPNPVFMDYISHVLPMLGEERVEQRAVGELAGMEPARREEPGLARLKGDARLADVIAAAVRALPSPPAEQAGHEALREGRTALIAPATLIAGLEPLLPGPGTAFDELAAPIQALTPRAAKGLEFDRVVLVEPARIVSEADRIEGLRALYVALTRATKTLVVVHAEALPVELGLGLG